MRNNKLKEVLKARFIKEIDPSLLQEIGISKTRLNRILENTEDQMAFGPINSNEIRKICLTLNLSWDWEKEVFTEAVIPIPARYLKRQLTA
jgi:DNA-binding Xre family transcriptional regulator